MPFFIPESLIRLEYFVPSEKENQETDEYARLYADEYDFAFFCVHFNYSKADYNALTPIEKAFILKAYENKVVQETTLFRDAVLNAGANLMPKKSKRFIPLWKKRNERVNFEEIENDIEILSAANEKNKINWVERVLKGGNCDS